MSTLRTTEPHRHVILLRLIGGVPILLIGLAHIFAEGAEMWPLAEATGLPFAALLAPLGVAVEIAARVSMILDWWARVGALLAIPTMAMAFYSRLVIDV